VVLKVVVSFTGDCRLQNHIVIWLLPDEKMAGEINVVDGMRVLFLHMPAWEVGSKCTRFGQKNDEIIFFCNYNNIEFMHNNTENESLDVCSCQANKLAFLYIFTN